MEKHVTILGILHIAFSALALLIGVIVFLVLIGGGLASGDEEAIIGTATVGTVAACILLIFALPGLIGGIGLMKYKNWARILIIVLGVLNILNFPIGTVLGAYTLWALLNDETTRLFKSRSGF